MTTDADRHIDAKTFPFLEKRYAICFDFPEMNGDPVFAVTFAGVAGIERSLGFAKRFQSEQAAERFLKGNYSEVLAGYATVVEVGQ